MDCGKAWIMMMRKMDGAIRKQDSTDLEAHMNVCGDCRERWNLTQTAVRELESNPPQAPENIERSVMARLCFIRQKKETGMLPYVVSPAAILSGLLAVLIFNAYKAGPLSLIDEAARMLSSLMKALQAFASVVPCIFKIPYLSEILVAFIVCLFVSAAAIVFTSLKRMNENRIYWRASK